MEATGVANEKALKKQVNDVRLFLMNISYISGFFDADGYVTIIKIHKNELVIAL